MKIFLKLMSLLILSFTFSNTLHADWFGNLFGSNYSYNVLFYTPANKEIFLGTTKTISDCRTKAYREADYKKMPADYICCKTDGKSFCISKHK